MDIRRPDLKRKRQLKRTLWIGIAISALLLLAVVVSQLEPNAPEVDADSVWVEAVRRGDFVREVRGPGTLVPSDTRLVSTASAGTVERILVRPGARVDADTILVEISNPQMVQEVEEIRWEVDAMAADLISLEAELERQLLDARGSLATIRAEHEVARLEADAQEELKERRIVSSIKYQQTRVLANELGTRVQLEEERIERLEASIQAQLDAESARLEQARQRLQRHKQRVADLSIRAGVAGVVQRIDVEEGQRLESAANVGQVARPDDLIAELRIPESQARLIEIDQQVTVDTRNAQVLGRVIRINPAVVEGTVQVDVELTGELPQGARPDLSVDGTIQLELLENVLFVGRPAGSQPESTLSLFRVEANGEAERVTVELGRASVNEVEIRAGLQPGDRVILSNTSQWDDHDRIRLD